MWYMRRYLESRILLWVMPIVALGSVSMALAIRHLDMTEFDEALEAKIQVLATLLVYDGTTATLNLLDDFMPEFSREQPTEYFQIANIDGSIIKRSKSLGVDSLLPLYLNTHREVVFHDLTLPDGRNGRMVQHVFDLDVLMRNREEWAMSDEEQPGHPSIIFAFAKERTELDTLLWSIYAALFVVNVLLLTAVYILVHKILKKGLHPLMDLNSQLKKMAPDTLDQRIDLAATPGELSLIVSTINLVFARLEAAFRREQQFTGDVAHELRTPVAELRLACEVGATWMDDPALVKRRLEDLAQTALDMEHKVNSLLELSRLDNKAVKLEAERIYLNEILTSTASRLCDMNNPLALDFKFEVPPDACVLADKARFEILVLNLFSNCLQYATPGSTVWVDVHAAVPDQWCLSISNQTQALEPSDLPHLFDRFWRKDAARTEGSHSGLGLSIVKSVAEWLKIEICVSLPSPDRFTISLKLPQA